jgi:hypothetical protein
MSEFDKDDGQVDKTQEIPDADADHPDHDDTATIDEDLEPDDVQDEEELEEVDDAEFDDIDVEDVPVLEEGADD